MVDATELRKRPLVVVHAEVDEDVGKPRIAGVALGDEQRGRLLAAAVAAGGLGGVEAVEQPGRQRLSRAAFERLRKRVDGGGRHEDVSLRGVSLSGPPARPVMALVTRVRRAV